MLYELVAVVRKGNIAEAKEICRAVGSLILAEKGVVRSVDYWGTFLMTRPTVKRRAMHLFGQRFVVRFDGDVETQGKVRELLNIDPRMIRHDIVKLGDGTLPSLAKYAAPVWRQNIPGQKRY